MSVMLILYKSTPWYLLFTSKISTLATSRWIVQNNSVIYFLPFWIYCPTLKISHHNGVPCGSTTDLASAGSAVCAGQGIDHPPKTAFLTVILCPDERLLEPKLSMLQSRAMLSWLRFQAKHSSDFAYKHVVQSWLFGALVVKHHEALCNSRLGRACCDCSSVRPGMGLNSRLTICELW